MDPFRLLATFVLLRGLSAFVEPPPTLVTKVTEATDCLINNVKYESQFPYLLSLIEGLRRYLIGGSFEAVTVMPRLRWWLDTRGYVPTYEDGARFDPAPAPPGSSLSI